MIYEDLKVGDVFTIENTPSYPKLKLENNAYVDMRDEILNKSGETVMGREVSIMTTNDVATEFNTDFNTIANWIESKKSKFLKDN